MDNSNLEAIVLSVAYGLATLTHAVAHQPGMNAEKLKADIEAMLDGLASEQQQPHMQQVMQHIKKLMLDATAARDTGRADAP